MSDLPKSGEDFDAEVVEADRGGLVVDVGPRGFDPLSQFASVGSLSALGAGGWEPPDVLRARVGKRLPLKVIEGRSAPGPADPVGEGRGAGRFAGGGRKRRRAA